MSSIMLNDVVCVPVSSELYQALAARYPDTIGSLLENISWDYLERTEDDFMVMPKSGYNWSGLSLPSGTHLRVKKSHSNDYGYAEITGEKIIYLGKDVRSPSQFARKVRNNTSVNAWINIEIKRPQDRDWKLANSFR